MGETDLPGAVSRRMPFKRANFRRSGTEVVRAFCASRGLAGSYSPCLDGLGG